MNRSDGTTEGNKTAAPAHGETANGKPVELIVVVRRVHVGTIQVQVEAVVGIVGRTRPIVAVRTAVVRR